MGNEGWGKRKKGEGKMENLEGVRVIGAWRRETGDVVEKREKGLFGNILDYKLF